MLVEWITTTREARRLKKAPPILGLSCNRKSSDCVPRIPCRALATCELAEASVVNPVLQECG